MRANRATGGRADSGGWPPRTVIRRSSGLRTLESALYRSGLGPVAGVDEVGRGACAGPLVVAACVLGPNRFESMAALDDSKKLTEKTREELFPLIRRMETTGEVPRAHCGSVGNPIRVMEHEHDRAGEALRRLRELTGGYEAPADGCTTYRALMADLAEMESDLHLHIHKENNILHPRARRLEEDLAARDGRKGNE